MSYHQWIVSNLKISIIKTKTYLNFFALTSWLRFTLMKEIIVHFGFVGLLFHDPSKCTKTKTWYKNKKEFTVTNNLWWRGQHKQSIRWLETGVKPKCSLRWSTQTRGNKISILKSCPLFPKKFVLNIGQALVTTSSPSTVFPEQRRT